MRTILDQFKRAAGLFAVTQAVRMPDKGWKDDDGVPNYFPLQPPGPTDGVYASTKPLPMPEKAKQIISSIKVILSS